VNLSNKEKCTFLMLLFSLLSWMIGLLGIYYEFDEYGFSNSVLKITFIELVLLTVPDMVLVDELFRAKFKISNLCNYPRHLMLRLIQLSYWI